MAKHALIEAEPETPPRKRKHLLWIIPLTLAILAGAIYGGGVWYFSEHFLPNTTVEGDDVSLQTTEELATLIESPSSATASRFPSMETLSAIPTMAMPTPPKRCPSRTP